MKSTDKADIIKAMRDVALALERGTPNSIDLMQALGTEMLVLALVNGPGLVDIGADRIEALARREIVAITDNIAAFHEHMTTEVEILTERLVRQFDPSMAWNEAINRAIVAKKAKGEEAVMMTPTQKTMFDRFQVPTTMKALRSA